MNIPRNEGKIFEDAFRDSIDADVIYYERVKDPAASFGGGAKTRFSTHNPYDSYAYTFPYFFALELKSTKEKSISFSTDDNKKQIKKCKIEGLSRARSYKGVIAGLVFNFREQELTYFLDIDNFNKFIESTTKKSINIKDVIDFGGILIPQRRKKVKYVYDTNTIFNMIGEENCE